MLAAVRGGAMVAAVRAAEWEWVRAAEVMAAEREEGVWVVGMV